MVPTSCFTVVLALSVAVSVTRPSYNTARVSELWLPLTGNGTCSSSDYGVLQGQWVQCVPACTADTVTVAWYCFDQTVPWPRDLTGAHWDTDATVVPLFEAIAAAAIAGIVSSSWFALALRCGGLLIFGVAYGTVFCLARLAYELWTHENSEVHSFGWLTGIVSIVSLLAVLSASSALLAVAKITQDAAKVVSCRWALVCGSIVATLLQCAVLATGAWLTALSIAPCLRVSPAAFSLLYRHIELVDYDACVRETGAIVFVWFWVATFVRHSWQVATALFAVSVIRAKNSLPVMDMMSVRASDSAEQEGTGDVGRHEREPADGSTATEDVPIQSQGEAADTANESVDSGTFAKDNAPRSGVLACWCHALAAHHGTIALGSFVTTVTWAVFLCVRYVRRHTETLRRYGSGTEALHRSLLCVARCCSGLCVVMTDITLRRVYAAVAVDDDSIGSAVRRLRTAMTQHPLVYALVTASTAFVETLHICACAVGGGYTVVQMGVTTPSFVVLGASVAVMTGKTVGSPLRMVIEVTALLRTDVQGGVP